MMLTPRELEKLNVFVAAELARRRKKRGLKLNHPEAVSILADHILEGSKRWKNCSRTYELWKNNFVKR